MPRVSFKQEFKSADTERFPKLKLAVAEKSRLWIPAREEPWMEWYHRIEAPLIEHGEPAMEVKETRRGPVETWKMDWIGNVFCIGETGTPEDPGPLMLAGIDPANCPACESAANKTGVAAPQQRFSINIIKYKVKGRGTKPYDLASPISAEVLLWGYTSRIFGMLHELESEHGDLSRHDIKLELEDSPGADTYQKIKQLAVIVEPAYTNPQVKAYLRDLWGNEENRATDDQLRDACLGRDVPRLVMMDMVRRAEKQYKQAEQVGSGGGDTAAADSGFNGDLSSGVDALLDAGPKNEEALARVAEMQDPWADEAQAVAGTPDGGGLDEFADPTDADIDRLPHSAFQAPAGPLANAMGLGEDPALAAQRAAVAADDPFGDETSSAGGATTTGTPAPAAERASSTAPKSATSAGSSEDEDLNEPVAETPKAAGRRTKPKAAASEQLSLDAPEPQPAAAGAKSGAVIDFDDLFA